MAATLQPDSFVFVLRVWGCRLAATLLLFSAVLRVRLLYTHCVAGATALWGYPAPRIRARFRLFSSVVEHPPCKRRVTSSNLVRGSTTVTDFAALQWKNLIRFPLRSVIYHLCVGDRPIFVPLFYSVAIPTQLTALVACWKLWKLNRQTFPCSPFLRYNKG